jgi:outer membrane immunogenic protein
MDRMMVYATGGIALAGGTYNNIADKVVDDYTRAGLTVGGGLEFAVTDNVSIKAEYLYANFGRFTVGTTEATPDFHLVRAGLNFKF